VRAELEREVASMYNVRAARHAREWMSAVVELGVRQKMISLVNHRVQLVG